MRAERAIERLEKKLDAFALEQLREVASQLYTELEETRAQLYIAEENAEFWREQVFSIQEQLAGHKLAIDQTCGLHIVKS